MSYGQEFIIREHPQKKINYPGILAKITTHEPLYSLRKQHQSIQFPVPTKEEIYTNHTYTMPQKGGKKFVQPIKTLSCWRNKTSKGTMNITETKKKKNLKGSVVGAYLE